MRIRLRGRDVVALVGLAAAAGLAVSLGADAALAAELAVAAALLQLVVVLLRARPAPRPPRTVPTDQDALATCRRAVRSALLSQWGVQGRFRRIVRDAVRARLDRREQDVDDVLAELPEELAVLLAGQWEHERGLTPAELDRILTAVERLEP